MTRIASDLETGDAGSSTTQLAPESSWSCSGVVSRRNTILIVDDDDEGSDVVRVFLTKMGYHVLTARTGAQARALLVRNAIDLLLLDVDLPDSRGTSLLREWRADRTLHDLPVLMTTALDSPDEMVAAFNSGANDYITKPFDFDVLAARMAAHLRTKTRMDWERQAQSTLARSLVRLGVSVHGELCGEVLVLWLRELVLSLEQVFPGRAIAAWSSRGDAGGELTMQFGSAPPVGLTSAHRRTLFRTLTPLIRQSAIWLPVTKGTSLLGVLSLELAPDDPVESLVRLTSGFASQLSVHLDLRDSRAEKSHPPGHEASKVVGLGVCPACRRCVEFVAEGKTTCPVDGSEIPSGGYQVQAVVEQRYHLERLIGEGGMGAVFYAHDAKLSRPVAVKVLHPQLADRDDLRRRFIAEATLCARLRHPHLVSVFDFGELTTGGLFLVMEWVNGSDLSRHISLQHLLGPSRVAEILRQIAEALDHCHQNGVIHRDVKPSNVLLSRDNGLDVRLVDFGVARRVMSGSSRTLPGHIIGTPKYLAPEQAMGGRVGPGTDVYALATLTFELLAGTHANRRGQGSADLSDSPISLEHPLFGKATPAFSSLFASAWRGDLRERPAHVLPWALELAEEIERLEATASDSPVQ